MSWFKNLKIPLLQDRADSVSGNESGWGSDMPDAAPAPAHPARQRFNNRNAVGIGNVWRFPYVAYDNGGAAFLLPYMVALFAVGTPLAVFELLVGQYFQASAVHVWSGIHWRLRGVGLAGIGTSFLVGLYYNILLAWSLVYMIYSFSGTVPWSDVGPRAFFDDVILGKTDSINDFGTLNWASVLALAVTWIFIYLSISRGVKSSGKVALVTVTLPYVVLMALLIRGVTLPGAGVGLKFLFEPDWSLLLRLQVWVTAVQQILFSLSPTTGILVTFGSFVEKDLNMTKDGLIISAVNSITSLMAGIAVFSTLGFLAVSEGKEVDHVAAQGPDLVFVVFPAAISKMPAAPLFAIMFFLMLFLLGIDSSFARMETVNDVVHQMVPHWNPKYIAAGTCLIQFFAGCWFAFGNGIYWLALFDRFTVAFIYFAIGALECIAVAYVYGMDQFMANVHETTGRALHRGWAITWRYIVPVVCTLLFIGAIVNEAQVPLSQQPGMTGWSEALGWITGFTPVGVLIFFALYRVDKTTFYPSDGSSKSVRTQRSGSVRQQYRRVKDPEESE